MRGGVSRKTHYSNWHIVVNTNGGNEAIQVGRLRSAVQEMALPDELWKWLVYFDYGSKTKRPFTADEKLLVERVRVRAAFEREGAGRRGLHLHMLLEVTHRTMVQIEAVPFRQLFSRYTGRNPNVKIRFLRGDSSNKDFILHYITKEVPGPGRGDADLQRMTAAMRSGDVIEADTSQIL